MSRQNNSDNIIPDPPQIVYSRRGVNSLRKLRDEPLVDSTKRRDYLRRKETEEAKGWTKVTSIPSFFLPSPTSPSSTHVKNRDTRVVIASLGYAGRTQVWENLN